MRYDRAPYQAGDRSRRAEDLTRVTDRPRSYEACRPDVDTAFSWISKDAADALVAIVDGLTFARRPEIIAFAVRSRLPTIYSFREAPDDGGLMSYGVNLTASYRTAVTFVHEILNGSKTPRDLPVEQPTSKGANALGLMIPPSVLARVDQLIQ